MSLQQAMEAARSASENLPATQDTDTTGSLPVQYGTGLSDFLSGGKMNVDGWLQLNETGIKLDRNEKMVIEEFEADIDVASVQLFVGLRGEFAGNKVEYRQSNDGGKTTTLGENFTQVLHQWQSTAVKPVSPYRGANMALILTEDVTQGKTTIPAGTRIGYTTPVTGFAPFQNLLKKLVADGVIDDAGGGRLSGQDTVRIKFTHDARENSSKQPYGVLLMEVVG